MIPTTSTGRRRTALLAGALLGALALAGCAADGVLAEHVPADAPADCSTAATDPTPALGCANRANLAAMVANPADLQQGQPLSPASGARQAAVVETYRKGQVKPLNPSATTIGVGATTSGNP